MDKQLICTEFNTIVMNLLEQFCDLCKNMNNKTILQSDINKYKMISNIKNDFGVIFFDKFILKYKQHIYIIINVIFIV